MKTSIVITDTHEIVLDSFGRFSYNDKKITYNKDIPFVRYRFSSYEDRHISYIEKMQKKFNYSAHMAEVMFEGESTADVLDTLEEIEGLIVFLYIPVTNEEVLNGFSESKLESIKAIASCNYDRIMLKDFSTNIHYVALDKLKEQVYKATNFSVDDMGICSSALSFIKGQACLTAVRARELAAEYCENEEAVIPSANHECMNTCGCIKYIVIDKPIYTEETKKADKEKKDKTDTSEKKVTKKKGLPSFRW